MTVDRLLALAVYAAHRLRLAAPAAGLAALVDGPSLVPAALVGGCVRAPRSRARHDRTRAGRARGQLDRQHSRRAGCPFGRCRRGGRELLRSGAARGRAQGHALTDTDGRLLVAAVSPANLHDSRGGAALLRASRRLWPFQAHCFADRAYQGERIGSATAIAMRSSCRRRTRTALPFSRGAGWSNEPSAGSPAAAGWPATARQRPPQRWPSSSSPQPWSLSDASQQRYQTGSKSPSDRGLQRG